MRLLQISSKIQSENHRLRGKSISLVHDSSYSWLGIGTLLSCNMVQVVLVGQKSDVNDLSAYINRILASNHQWSSYSVHWIMKGISYCDGIGNEYYNNMKLKHRVLDWSLIMLINNECQIKKKGQKKSFLSCTDLCYK